MMILLINAVKDDKETLTKLIIFARLFNVCFRVGNIFLRMQLRYHVYFLQMLEIHFLQPLWQKFEETFFPLVFFF